jgi:hypothetical protein
MPGVIPVACGGVRIWLIPAPANISSDDSEVQRGGDPLGHPWGNATSRVAIEARLEASYDGRDLKKEAGDIPTNASQPGTGLKAAMGTREEIECDFYTVVELGVSRGWRPEKRTVGDRQEGGASQEEVPASFDQTREASSLLAWLPIVKAGEPVSISVVTTRLKMGATAWWMAPTVSPAFALRPFSVMPIRAMWAGSGIFTQANSWR